MLPFLSDSEDLPLQATQCSLEPPDEGLVETGWRSFIAEHLVLFFDT